MSPEEQKPYILEDERKKDEIKRKEHHILKLFAYELMPVEQL